MFRSIHIPGRCEKVETYKDYAIYKIGDTFTAFHAEGVSITADTLEQLKQQIDSFEKDEEGTVTDTLYELLSQ